MAQRGPYAPSAGHDLNDIAITGARDAVGIEKMGSYAAMREHRMDCAKYTR